MMRKGKGGSLGKSLIRDRFKKRNPNRDGDSFLHTSELNDGYDWGRLNLQSVTEQSNLDDFLTTAELAGVDFTAEKLNVKIVDVNRNTGLLTAEEQENVKKLHEQHKDLLSIPRRPAWDSTTTGEELNRKEKEAFLDWRRSLSTLQEVDGIVMTPYEKNLDFWRQLWRVIERSDVVVQIVDARNPLLFYCEDLERYVKEVGNEKVNLLLINKADYLTEDQRKIWSEYFASRNIKVAFWSALEETTRYEESKKNEREAIDETGKIEPVLSESDDNDDEEDIDEVDENKDLDDNEKMEKGSEGAQSSSIEISNDQALVSRLESDKKISSDCDEINSDDKEKCDDQMLQNVDGTDFETDHSCLRSQQKNCSSESNFDVNSAQNEANNICEDASKMDISSACDEVCDSFQEKIETDHKCDNDELDKNETDHKCEIDKLLIDSKKELSCENSARILTGLELLDLFRTLHTGKKVQPGLTTVGMVGYPNVGKSSSINAILKTKKVPVSATPGRTKHFQTLYVDTDLMLCDCPGLVFPSFVSTKAELIVNGILPIDQMRDHVPPVSLVCQCIPRSSLESTYGINLPLPQEGENPHRAPTAQELLNTYGYMRGFMTSNGLPDCPRSSRYILKDFVKGRLLYCNPPPGIETSIFHPTPDVNVKDKRKISESEETDSIKSSVVMPSKLDREFFSKAQSKVHSKGVHGVPDFARAQGLNHVGATSDSGSPMSSQSSLTGKPWKKHHNKKKREKLRKIYTEHDS